MNPAVTPVEAHPQISGSRTVSELPVIETRTLDRYGVATDFDILAFLFQGAGSGYAQATQFSTSMTTGSMT